MTSAGAHRTSDNPNILQRSFWGRSQEDIEQQIAKWQDFSQAAGFEENEKKMQITSGTNEIKFLGVVTARKPRVNHHEEEARLRKATLRADLLRRAALPLDHVIAAARSLVAPVAAYGWVGRLPTQADAKSLFTSLTWPHL